MNSSSRCSHPTSLLFTIVFILYTNSLLCWAQPAQSDGAKILNGNKTSMIPIKIKKNHWCDTTEISKYFLSATAHCQHYIDAFQTHPVCCGCPQIHGDSLISLWYKKWMSAVYRCCVWICMLKKMFVWYLRCWYFKASFKQRCVGDVNRYMLCMKSLLFFSWLFLVRSQV